LRFLDQVGDIGDQTGGGGLVEGVGADVVPLLLVQVDLAGLVEQDMFTQPVEGDRTE
jgi:hypothetical protein